MKKNSIRLFVLLAVLIAGSTVCSAQGLGRIGGLVTDKGGASVPGAKVTVVQKATGTQSVAVTNAKGEYVFPSLPPAAYRVLVEENGFAKYEADNVVLQADQSLTVNVALEVGSTSETVEVSAAPPQVDITTGTLAQVVSEREINELPLNGRNAAALTTLVAGVLPAPSGASDQGNTKTFPAVVNVAVNGTRANQTNYLLDGGNNVDEYTNVNAPFPFPDALQEFSVQTSNYAAEYGQSAGGVVNIITRSGTSQYHGNAFEYVRNAALNAHNHFGFNTNSSGVLVPYVDPLKRNQFGGTFGGPVGLPFLGKVKQGFFFLGYQHTALRTQTTSIATSNLPTAANKNGLFNFNVSTTGGTPTPAAIAAACVTNPYLKTAPTGNPQNCFPYTLTATAVNGAATTYTYQSTVPTSMFDQASLKLLNYVPVSTTSGTPFAYQKPTSQNLDEGVGRFDQDLGTHDHLVARYFIDLFQNKGVLNPQNLLTYADASNIRYQNALVSESHTFTPNLLNSLIVSYQREVALRGPVPGAIDVGDLGVNIYQPPTKAIQTLSVSGFFSIGDNPTGAFKRSNVTLADDLHWVKGNHSFAFGFHGELSRIDVVNQNGQPGQFTFNATTTNSAIASFFLGYVSSFKQTSGQYQNDRAKYTGGYVQDVWKATRRLTLDYGLRYEPYIPIHEADGRVGQFNPTAEAHNQRSIVYPNAPVGLLFRGDPGVPEDGIRATYKNFMPRTGFALDVFGDGRTSLRGGGGLFFDTRSDGLFNNGWIGSTPFSTSVSYTNVQFSNPYGSNPNPFPAPVPPPQNTTFVTPFPVITFDPSGNFQVPLTYAYNLATEQQFTSSLSLRIAYVGVHASHVFTSPEINPGVCSTSGLIPGSTTVACSSSNLDARRYYNLNGNPTGKAQFQTISLTDMGATSKYNSLQVTLRNRLSKGLSGAINYTWSKSLDDVPALTSVTSAGPGVGYVLPTYMPHFQRLDYGPSDFDHRNNLVLNYVWVLPSTALGDRAFRYAVNGWQVNGIFSFRSGDALSLLLGKDVSGTGTNRDVPLQVGPAYGSTACGAITLCASWLNPAGFASPAPGNFGNVKHSSFVGPQYIDWDASLARNFAIHDDVQLQFRAEYFNVLNHTNLGDPNLNLATSFGRITSANDPRIAQLALKLAF